MYVKELWRYPVKSMAGERVAAIDCGPLGLADDRRILVTGPKGRVVTSRTHPKLLGLKGSLSPEGIPLISGHLWTSNEALRLVRQATGANVDLSLWDGPERFDILPLLVATDGAIAHMGFDGRRLRPNIIVGGVEGLTERQWPGRSLRIGDAVVHTEQLRGRCVMTTYDPDTQVQDLNVLKAIVRELAGVMALDSSVEKPGRIWEGAPVSLIQPQTAT